MELKKHDRGLRIAAAIEPQMPAWQEHLVYFDQRPGMIDYQSAFIQLLGVAAVMENPTWQDKALIDELIENARSGALNKAMTTFKDVWGRCADSLMWGAPNYEPEGFRLTGNTMVYFEDAFRFRLDGPNGNTQAYLASEERPILVRANAASKNDPVRVDALIKAICNRISTSLLDRNMTPAQLEKRLRNYSKSWGAAVTLLIPINLRLLERGEFYFRSTALEIEHLKPKTLLRKLDAVLRVAEARLKARSGGDACDRIKKALDDMIAESGLPLTVSLRMDNGIIIRMHGYQTNLLSGNMQIAYLVGENGDELVEKARNVMAQNLVVQGQRHRMANGNLLPSDPGYVDLSQWRIETALFRYIASKTANPARVIQMLIAMRGKHVNERSPAMVGNWGLADLEILRDHGVLRGRFQLSDSIFWAPGTITLYGTTIPDTLVSGLRGCTLGQVISHPMLPADAKILACNSHQNKAKRTVYTLTTNHSVSVEEALAEISHAVAA